MEIKKFREGVKPGVNLSVEGKSYLVNQVIKFKLDDGSFYFKCYLSDDKVIAEDSEMNVYIFVGPVQTDFTEPMPERLNFDSKEFKFLYDAHAAADEVWGEGEFKKGDTERFWDYEAHDDSYLSLGINEQDDSRADFYGKKVSVSKVEIK